MKLTNKTYDSLKWIAQYLIPAVGTLYFALADIWGLGYAKEVLGTLTAIDTFLAVVLGVSSKNYEGDGTLHMIGDEALLELNSSKDDFENQQVIMLKVQKRELYED